MRADFIHSLAVCIEHYMERGYTVEQALEYCCRSEEDVFRIYEIIQNERQRGFFQPQNMIIQKEKNNGEYHLLP